MFQSCVLDVIGNDNQDVQTNFVICAMDFSKNPSNCAKNIGVNLNKVDECMRSNKVVQLQLKAEQESEGIIKRSGFVPTVNFNNPLASKSHKIISILDRLQWSLQQPRFLGIS